MKRISATLVIIAVAAIFFALWWQISLSPVNPNDTVPRSFVIAGGDGVKEISKKLRDQGLIRDQVAFFLLVRYRLGIDKKLQAGNYQLSPSLSATQLAQQLTTGIDDLRITIPEGWRSEQILEYLTSLGFVTAGQDWKESEGRLFPDTYLVPKKMAIEQLHDLLVATFIQKADGVSQDTLILASLVEREARKDSDRFLVAGVLKNRLDAGMALDVDATIQYILGQPGNWWPKELTPKDLKTRSPYNTYLSPGLPPRPIANPGLSAIKAARNPAQTDYLFYLSDESGNTYYARTLSEHNQNIARYLD